MLDLKSREWLPFLLSDIFEIKHGKRLTKADMKKGSRPFIGATDSNNGITNFVSNSNSSLDKEVLGVNYNGSVVETFYHPYECVFSDDVKRFVIKATSLSRQIYLFLKSAIIQQKVKYAYGYKFNEQRMSKQSILLPTDESGNPDWQFMEDYIREREEGLVQQYIAHAEQILRACEVGEVAPLRDKEWGEFVLGKEFSIQSTSSSIDKIKLTEGEGNAPYITRTDRNNGIDSFVREQKGYDVDCGNCITIGLDTQTAFYQPTAFYTGQNIQVLRSEWLNSHIAKFLLPFLKNALSIFSWGSTGATLTRLKRTKILLPMGESGNPDWAYMEQYAKVMMGQQVREYLAYVAR